jgi:hypothetical protein
VFSDMTRVPLYLDSRPFLVMELLPRCLHTHIHRSPQRLDPREVSQKDRSQGRSERTL